VKFLFEELGAAVRVEQIFCSISPRSDLQAYGSVLKRAANLHDALAMGMIQRFGNSQDRGETPRNSLVAVIERGIGEVVPRGLRFSIVVAHQRGDDRAIAAFQAGNIAVEHKIFAVLVMAAMADHVPGVMHERAGFQQNARLCRKMVDGLKLVEEQNAQLANVLGVRLILLQAPRETASAHEQLPRGYVVTVRLRPGKGLMGDFLDQSFAKADAGDRKIANVEVAPQRDKRKCSDAQHVRAIAPDAVGLHALAHIALQEIWQAFAQQ